MARFKQNKGITEKMLNAILSVNDISEIGRKQNIVNKPFISPNSTSPLNPYQANAWLFKGLNKNK